MAGFALGEEAGVAQHAQVLGCGGPTDIEVSGDLAGRELAFPDEAQDSAPSWRGDGVQSGLHLN